MTLIVTFNMRKGGTMKTTLVRNLADGCARAGLKTIVVDADSQHTLTMTMRVNPVDALTTLLTDDTVEWGDVLAEVPEEFSGAQREYFYLLPTFDGQQAIENQAGIPDRIYERFQELRGYADVVLVDTSPGAGNIHAGFYQVSDGIFLPCLCELESVLGLTATLNHLYTISQSAPVAPVMGIIPNHFDASEMVQQINHKYIVDHYAQYGRIFNPIRDKTIWRNASQNRQSVYRMTEHKSYNIRKEAKIAVAELQPILDTILKAVQA
jgi:chromosome partitioning protein